MELWNAGNKCKWSYGLLVTDARVVMDCWYFEAGTLVKKGLKQLILFTLNNTDNTEHTATAIA